jgi:hypothetical protein
MDLKIGRGVKTVTFTGMLEHERGAVFIKRTEEPGHKEG